MTTRNTVAGLIAVVMTTVIGAIWISDGPDPSLLPEFADEVWVGSDGPLFVARYEVTISEWNRCVYDGDCSIELKPRPGFDPDTTPATGLNWFDAQDYAGWISKATGHPMRLPTMSEWAAVAADVIPEAPDPAFTDPALAWASSYVTEEGYSRALESIGSFAVSPDGISDLDGPVWEWTSDCYDPSVPELRCAAFYAGGLHTSVLSPLTKDPARGGCAVGAPPAHLGVRLVSDQSPPQRRQI
ncbi:MAG: SUMF1/EgtB/PvdO family nonheme iron enzyme [Boseongicola sp.]|nr:SUMF1/EgtB/PvdO family nonheme iron enzyme [Boseongicola sp.]